MKQESIHQANFPHSPTRVFRPLAPDNPVHPEQELSAGPDQDAPEAGLDPTLPINEGQGAPGHRVPEYPPEDEDAEGRTIAEQVYEEGAQQAERDKVQAAARKEKPGEFNG